MYDVAQYVLPEIFEDLAAFLIFSWSWYRSLAVVVLVPGILLALKIWFRQGEQSAREDFRKLIHQSQRQIDPASSSG
ncbi:MAG: hypothetical protein HC788_09825 [Sphingopyxis sp.]|nr:hypothetical protein [Sphingopyxis sp.]